LLRLVRSKPSRPGPPDPGIGEYLTMLGSGAYGEPVSSHDPQMLKGVLSLLLLELCAQHEDYGYSLVLRLREVGFPEISEGSVYPALSRLEAQGLLQARLVRSSAGPARKYYATTVAGDEELVRARGAWDALVGVVASVRTQEVPT
jgi:PadR family transcriptional regulator PadR